MYIYTTESRPLEKCRISEHLKEYKLKNQQLWHAKDVQADKRENLKESIHTAWQEAE